MKPTLYVATRPDSDGCLDCYDSNGNHVGSAVNDDEGQIRPTIAATTGLDENAFDVNYETMCKFDDGKVFPAWFERPHPG